ncbi:hypothetical protein [Streptomyces sp. NPDC059761]|uniref:hypothetical protein n=1 Tax=Streptomyces sp. NPDC059761 TaxID=3346937 RepID=UPI003669A0ED
MSNAEILAKLADAVRTASKNLATAQDRVRQDMDRDEEVGDRNLTDLMLAEGIRRQYRELGYSLDGVLKRHEGETDEDMVKFFRRKRRTTLGRFLENSEDFWPGVSGIRQHQNREAVRRFLRETAFVAEGK